MRAYAIVHRAILAELLTIFGGLNLSVGGERREFSANHFAYDDASQVLVSWMLIWCAMAFILRYILSS